jgi:hypothetical protein
MAVGWALPFEAPLEPLIVFSAGSILYILNPVKGEVVGHLCGHGGVSTCALILIR